MMDPAEKKALIVSCARSLVVNTLLKGLTGESFRVDCFSPNEALQKSIDEFPAVVLVYFDSDMEEMRPFLLFVRDRLKKMRQDVLVYLIGSREEVGQASQFLPENLTEGVFLRPLNVKELVAKLGEAGAKPDDSERPKRILVVDDDGMMLRTLKLWLSDHYQVYMANSGTNAMSLLEEKEVDLILLDYEMPVASGPEVLEMIRSNPSTSHLPIMFLTAKNDKESIEKVMQMGTERYLLKTMSPDVLLQNIDEFFKAR